MVSYTPVTVRSLVSPWICPGVDPSSFTLSSRKEGHYGHPHTWSQLVVCVGEITILLLDLFQTKECYTDITLYITITILHCLVRWMKWQWFWDVTLLVIFRYLENNFWTVPHLVLTGFWFSTGLLLIISRSLFEFSLVQFVCLSLIGFSLTSGMWSFVVGLLLVSRHQHVCYCKWSWSAVFFPCSSIIYYQHYPVFHWSFIGILFISYWSGYSGLW